MTEKEFIQKNISFFKDCVRELEEQKNELKGNVIFDTMLMQDKFHLERWENKLKELHYKDENIFS
jgi:hypothetical protein